MNPKKIQKWYLSMKTHTSATGKITKKWHLKKAKNKTDKVFLNYEDALKHFQNLNINARLWVREDGKFKTTIAQTKAESKGTITKLETKNDEALVTKETPLKAKENTAPEATVPQTKKDVKAESANKAKKEIKSKTENQITITSQDQTNSETTENTNLKIAAETKEGQAKTTTATSLEEYNDPKKLARLIKKAETVNRLKKQIREYEEQTRFLEFKHIDTEKKLQTERAKRQNAESKISQLEIGQALVQELNKKLQASEEAQARINKEIENLKATNELLQTQEIGKMQQTLDEYKRISQKLENELEILETENRQLDANFKEEQKTRLAAQRLFEEMQQTQIITLNKLKALNPQKQKEGAVNFAYMPQVYETNELELEAQIFNDGQEIKTEEINQLLETDTEAKTETILEEDLRKVEAKSEKIPEDILEPKENLELVDLDESQTPTISFENETKTNTEALLATKNEELPITTTKNKKVLGLSLDAWVITAKALFAISIVVFFVVLAMAVVNGIM